MPSGGALITVTGIEQVQAMLRDAPKHIVATAYVRALGAGAGVFYVDLQSRTPILQSEIYTAALAVAGHPRTSQHHPGDLLRALTTDIRIDSQFRGGTAEVGYAGYQGHVANWVEEGHRIVVKKLGGFYTDSRGRRRKGMQTGTAPPHPFLRPCWDQRSEEALTAFVSSIESTLRQEGYV